MDSNPHTKPQYQISPPHSKDDTTHLESRPEGFKAQACTQTIVCLETPVEPPEFLEEFVVQEIRIDAICGVY